jgi:Rrf2 family iron-sulfur cluster assembly transcriptional regulator
MQVTRAGEYAIIGLLYLARQPEGRTVMVEEISDSERVPRSFLAKIFQSLVKGGFVLSHRGKDGGFSLARQPCEINLLQIFQCVEGEFALQKCVSTDPECVVSSERLRSCNLCAVYSEAQSRVNEVFARTTLESLLKPRAPLIQPLAYSPAGH